MREHKQRKRSETCLKCGASDWYARPDGGRMCKPCRRLHSLRYDASPKGKAARYLVEQRLVKNGKKRLMYQRWYWEQGGNVRIMRKNCAAARVRILQQWEDLQRVKRAILEDCASQATS